MSDEDDDNEFFDAPEIITMPESMGHKWVISCSSPLAFGILNARSMEVFPLSLDPCYSEQPEHSE